MYILIFVSYFVLVRAGQAPNDSLKDQFCTDPRTMRKHAAYTEWADAYSCTRHRCQPGGRNLAIYTVGCKRVEAPESAIECEEVVEDTNMQFPYCCTRLRCLVVVRGEVWTRVLGQPWETLPAAPWSHMYKMKKPPPVDGAFLPKDDSAGPVYELAAESEAPQKVLRASKKDDKDCDEAVPRSSAGQTPDIVIALSTGGETSKTPEKPRSRHRYRKERREETRKEDRRYESSPRQARSRLEEDVGRDEIEAQEAPVITEKVPEVQGSYEAGSQTEETKTLKSMSQPWWTTQPPVEQWNEHDLAAETEAPLKNEAPTFHQNPGSEEKREEKPGNLQALVDAIGTRMRDIEKVVSRMSSKVQKPEDGEGPEIRAQSDKEKSPDHGSDAEHAKPKMPSLDGTQYQRFTDRKSSSQYLHGADITTEPPLYVEDANMAGYFSDASNNILRRNGPKEPAATYMAPVPGQSGDARRTLNGHQTSEEARTHPPHKKHTHKKKKSKRTHKKHRKEEKKRFNKVNSMEVDRHIVSLEDSALTNK